ncbi:hypothetical protein Pfo_024679 [Paulownia fortunei]|nr:hypothetical protein Pfo_024679 [Paulownia fortunei]
MELELGLALPNHTPMMIKGLDLNCSNNGLEMENNLKARKDQKWGFLDDQHGIEVENKALSLLLWSGQPDEEDDDRPQKWRKLNVNDENSDEENQEILGWPPINSLRKELLHLHQGGLMGDHQAAERIIAVRNYMYVKVKMEGVGIGRKIDVRLYDSYQALTNALINMFVKYSEIDRNRGDYTILYQDKEGDWMQVGDVQWETFVESVQRMEILKNDNKMGFRLLSRESYCKI